MIIDPMHNLYLGTAKFILKQVWIKQGFLSPSDPDEIDKRISSVIIPSNVKFARLPSTIGAISNFTAEQMMIYILYSACMDCFQMSS